MYSGLSWTGTHSEKGTVVKLSPRYKISHEVLYAHRTGDREKLGYKANAAYDIVNGIIDKVIDAGMSDYEKELAIHDYIVLNSKYDKEASELADGESNEHDSFNAFGLLFNKKGVCQAYSETMYIFMKLLDIECQIVSGVADGVRHSWNIVKLDGEYYQLDATWNDPIPDEPGVVSHAYFNITDQMIYKSHEPENQTVECVSDKYNYFTYEKRIVRNIDDFKRLVETAIANGDGYVEMKLEGFEIDQEAIRAASEITGQSSFEISKTSQQNVAIVFLDPKEG